MPRTESSYREVYASPEEINAFRKSLGLRPVVSGKVTCLHCNRIFKSEDARQIRICKMCKESKREVGIHDTVYSCSNMPPLLHFDMEWLNQTPLSVHKG